MKHQGLLAGYRLLAESAFRNEGLSPAYRAYHRVCLALQSASPDFFIAEALEVSKDPVQRQIYQQVLNELAKGRK